MSLRAETIRLAHQHPELRAHLLPLLVDRVAKEFPSAEALKEYLKEHPNADPANHTVKKPSEGEGKGDSDEGGEYEDVPEWASLETKTKGFLGKIKGLSKSMVKAVANAPKKVQQIVSDPEARKEALTSMATAVKKSPKVIANSVYEGAKKELKELKHAGHALGKVLRKPPEEWTKEDKKAVYGAAVYVAGAAVAAAGGGPLVAAGALGRSFALRVGAKAMHNIIDTGFTYFEAAETSAHGLHHVLHVMEHMHLAADEDEKLQQALIAELTAAVTKVLADGISNEEMEEILKGDAEVDPDDFAQPKVSKGKKATGEIGPYIRFDNRLWVQPYGYKLNPRPGTWDRLRLTDRKGRPLKTEVEVTWGKPGELTVYESHRRRPTYKYEDVGLFTPPTTLADVEKPPREARTLARQVAQTLRAEGLGADAARVVSADVAEDVNYHSLARILGVGRSPSSVDISAIGMALDWGVFSAGWFAVFLAREFGDSATERLVLDHMIETTADLNRQELIERLHRYASLRNRVIRLAHARPELRSHLLPLLRSASEVHVAVRDLPETVQRALKEVGYGRRDIRVVPATTFSFQDMGGDGLRSFTAVVNMETGASKVTYGSWGGPNPYSPRNLVDNDDRDHPIPVNGAIIQGHEGGSRPVYAVIRVHPDNMGTLVPAKVDLTPQEEMALAIIGGYKPAYRAEYFARHDLGLYKADNPLIDGLAKKGLVKVTGAGIQITTAGKNARNPRIHP